MNPKHERPILPGIPKKPPVRIGQVSIQSNDAIDIRTGKPMSIQPKILQFKKSYPT